MAVFKCKMCGASLEIQPGATTAECDYCGSQQTLPKLNDDRIARLHERAGHFRRNNEFDKAIGIYEEILNENTEDAESYWSLVLCNYGIEYVEDEATRKRLPTINRVQFTSIFDDDNYKSAIKYADISQKRIYEAEAKEINDIQKKILEISQNEEPFDVFISYKETDERGQRTRDSVYANELYHELTQEGFKVFYSRITLEDKLGSEYEPIIFAALNSAKVMVVIGTKPEHFNAVWVRNEWSRYLALIKGGAKKMLIPAFSGMDPYDLPEEFSHLQAQDMTKLGFMPDLVRGIKKIIGKGGEKAPAASGGTAKSAPRSSDTETTLKRASIFLDNQDWASADAYCEKALDIDPENAQAYIYKLMAQVRVSKMEMLVNSSSPLENMVSYKNAIRYADDETSRLLSGYNREIKERIARIEKERAEKARIDLENKERERRKAETINQLDNARLNTQTALSAQVHEKERLEKSLVQNEQDNRSFSKTSKKIKRLAYTEIIIAILSYVVFIIGAATSSPIMAFFVVFLFANVVATVLLAKKVNRDNMVLEGVKCYFTLGICGIIYAVKAIKDSNYNSHPGQKMVIEASLAQVEAQIDTLRKSLSEINRKIDEAKKAPVEKLSYASGNAASSGNSKCDVILESTGLRKLEVIASLRELLSIDLVSAKNLSEATPSLLLSGATEQRAQLIQSKLSANGATVRINIVEG